MKVKLLASFVGNADQHVAGDVIDVSEASALRLFADNAAIPYIPEDQIQQATDEQREKAVVITRRTGRPSLAGR